MKKVLSIILAAMLSVGIFVPSFADEAKSEIVSELILLVKEKLAINDEEFVFSDYYQNETETGNRYDLTWKSKDETNSSSLNVEIGENKTIYRYNFYDSTKKYGDIKYPKHTEAEALRAAKEFFKLLDSEKPNQVTDEKIRYEKYENAYVYTAQRVYNSMPVFGNDLSIQIDADSLKPTYYFINWDENLEFPEGNVISRDKAIEAYKDKLGYELVYQVVSEEYEDTVKLIYRSKYDEVLYIDAVSGEVEDFEGIYREVGGSGGAVAMSANKEEMTADSAVQLSEEERAMVDEISKMLSKEKAEAIARKITEFDITDAYNVSSYNIYKNAHGNYIGEIHLELNNKEEEKFGYRHISIDAKTGEVTAFNGYEDYDYKKDKKLTEEKTTETAEKFLNKYYSEKMAKMQKKNVFKPRTGRANYQRIENGIKVYNNGANIYMNETTEKIESFNINWTDAQMPDVKKAAEIEKLYEKLLTEENFRCGYLIINTEKARVAKAVYTLEKTSVFDAETLQELNYRLEPAEEEKKPEYTDIKGHYAENAALKLLSMDIYYPENELRPDEAVNQKAYLGLVSQVVFRYENSDNDRFYNYLMQRGVLTKEEINPEGTVKRIDAVRYLLNALGYGEFAKIPDIFNCPFVDITEENKGYGAIAAGLKLVNSETDTFYADNNLKRGDSLIMMYNYLTR